MTSQINKPVIIIGGSGHGCVIEACVKDNRNKYNDFEWEIAGYCNDFDTEVDGYPVLGKIADIPRLLEQGYYFAWGVHLIGKNHTTAKLFEGINIPDDRWATIIHHSAFIDDTVVLEPGVFVMYNAYIAPRTHVGKCTMIKANTNIGHDVNIGAISHIAMGSIIVSCVNVGYCSDVAVGATVLAHNNIGDFAMLAAAGLATHSIPSEEIHAGNPARLLKPMIE